MVGVRVEFRAVGRADQTLPEAHRRQTVPVRGVRTVFRSVRSSGAAQETPSAQERSGSGGATSTADGPSVVQSRSSTAKTTTAPTAPTAPTAAATVDDVKWRRNGARAKVRRRVHGRRSAAVSGLPANGSGLVIVIGQRARALTTRNNNNNSV